MWSTPEVAGSCCALIFDFDYTLGDSARGVVECVNYALLRLGLEAAPPEHICRTIGLSLPETLGRLTGERSLARAEEFKRLFVERADEVMADLTSLYPSVAAIMPALRQRGFRLGIVSTKFRYRIEAMLQREGVAGLFDAIVGGEDVARPKPDPEGLLRATERLGAEPSTSLYIGDSPTDAETAARAGVPFVAVLTGVTRRVEFAGLPVRGFVDDLNALPALLGLAAPAPRLD